MLWIALLSAIATVGTLFVLLLYVAWIDRYEHPMSGDASLLGGIDLPPLEPPSRAAPSQHASAQSGWSSFEKVG
jgi:hypothetical protein